MKSLVIFVLLCVVVISVKSQVLISPIPHPQGYFGLDDIWRINLISTQTQAVNVHLEVNIDDAQHGLILSATSPVFSLLQGNNRPVFNSSNTNMQFGRSSSTQTLRSTGRFPYGNYVVCYRLISANNGNLLAEFCQEELIRPFTPPELTNPFDGEIIKSLLPILAWKPPFPSGTIPIEYILRLVEIRPRQHIIEALEKNTPLLSQRGIFSSSLPYPGHAPKLEVGKSYAWQVSARAEGFDLGATEVWSFKVEEAEKLPPKPDKSFRELKLTTEGRFNPIDRKLKFSFNNRWGATVLAYENVSPPTENLDRIYYRIYPAGKQDSPVNPKIATNIVAGVNQVTIDLSGVSGINDGEEYVLVLRDQTGRLYYLEFTYHR